MFVGLFLFIVFFSSFSPSPQQWRGCRNQGQFSNRPTLVKHFNNVHQPESKIKVLFMYVDARSTRVTAAHLWKSHNSPTSCRYRERTDGEKVTTGPLTTEEALQIEEARNPSHFGLTEL